MGNAILLISCPDRKGINASVSHFIYENNGNIEHSDQHIDDQNNTFFMRVEWSLEGFKIAKENLSRSFSVIASKFGMKWDLYFTDAIPRIAIFVSRSMHCLYDLLLKYQAGHFRCEIPLIVSNHHYAKDVADFFKIRFFEFPVQGEDKKQIEKQEIDLLKAEKIDLVVLARYMQVLSGDFIKEFPSRIINIHHSFLPAFAGKDPYAQAYQRGVKIVGATSHYATELLDQGPIITQDIVRVNHRDSLGDFKRKGEDLEKLVLSRAVRLHLERKILTYGNKTVIFD